MGAIIRQREKFASTKRALMTNDEFLMTNEERKPNPQFQTNGPPLWTVADLAFPSSYVIRH